MNKDGISFVDSPDDWRPPPIPMRPCAFCGSMTNETEGVSGVAHRDCFFSQWARGESKRYGSAIAQAETSEGRLK